MCNWALCACLLSSYLAISMYTRWSRRIGCLVFTYQFLQKSPVISGSFAERDLQLEAYYASWPPCILIPFSSIIDTHACIHTSCIHTYIDACVHSCAHTYIHTYIHAYLHAYTNTNKHTTHKHAQMPRSLSGKHTHTHTHTHTHAHMCTAWRNLIGSPKLQIVFHKRATEYRSLVRKMTYKHKGSYESWPPCMHTHASVYACRQTKRQADK